MEQLGSHWTEFYLSAFRKSEEKINWNPTRITDTLHKDQHTPLIISPSVLLRMRRVSDKFAEKIKTHILYLIFFKSCLLWDKVEKYCTAKVGQVTDNSMAHAHCILDTLGYNFFFLWRNSHQRARASSLTRFPDHTQRRTTVGRTPLDERLARRLGYKYTFLSCNKYWFSTARMVERMFLSITL